MEKLELKKSKQSVLLTGAAGFLGSAIAHRLADDGYKVFALVRRSSNAKHLDGPQIKTVVGDVCDSELMDALITDVEHVIHAAATFGGDWENFKKVNIEATENLLKHSVKNKIRRFVYIGSVSVYEHAAIKSNQIFTEDMPYESEEHTTFYSKSKIEAERLVWKFIMESRLPGVIFRPGAIYGPRGDIFPATIGLGIGPDKIMLIGDAKSKLPLSYVENVADAVVRSLSRNDVIGECFNLVEDETLSRQDYVKAIKREANPGLSVLRFPLWFMQGLRLVLKAGFGLIGKSAPLSSVNLKMYCTTIEYSNEKFKKVFGSKPFVDFEESIRQTMGWHRRRLTPKRSQGIRKGKIVLSSERKLNVGIIGCGIIAKAHLNVLTKMENVGRIFAADPQEDACASLKEKFSIAKTYPDYKEMLASENIDVVHILTPPQFHAEIAQYAAQRGKNILVEKPFAVTAGEAEQIVKAAKADDVKLCVMHNHLFDKVMISAREILAKGSLGRITYVESWYGTQYGTLVPPFDPKSYWGYKLPGSLFQDYFPHALYVLLDVLGGGEIEDVIANYSGGVQGVEYDELKAILRHNSALGMVSISLSVSPRYQFVNVFGTAGSMKIDLLHKCIFLDKPIGPVPNSINRVLMSFKHAGTHISAGIRNAMNLNKVEESIFEGTDREIRLFYRSILLDEPEPVSAQEGYEVMRLMDEVWARMNSVKHQPSKRRLRA